MRRLLLHRAILLTTLVACMTLMSCSDKILDRNDPTPGGEEGISTDEMIPVSLTFDLPAMSTPGTRALSAVDETKVDLHRTRILIYDKDGHYLGEMKPTRLSQSGTTGVLTALSRPFTNASLTLLANLPDEAMNIPVSYYDTEMLDQFTFTVPETDFASKGLPMWGTVEGITLRHTKPVPTIQTTRGASPTIHLLRSVARVDVGLNMSGDKLDETSTPLTTTITDPVSGQDVEVSWSLRQVKLYNINSTGRVAGGNYLQSGVPHPDQVILPDRYEGIPGGGTVPAQRSLTYTSAQIQSNLLERVIYLPETDNKAKTTDLSSSSYPISSGDKTLWGDPELYKTRPYMTVQLHYEGAGVEGDTWYRIDFLHREGAEATAQYSYLPLLRNYRYKVDIRRIRDLGFASEEDAKKASSANIMYNVVVWDQSDMTNVIYDGGYMLGVSKEEIKVDRRGMEGITLHVKTDFPGGVVSTIPSASWYTVREESASTDTDKSFVITVDPNAGAPRSAILTFTAGRLQRQVVLTQSDTEDQSQDEYRDLRVEPSRLDFPADPTGGEGVVVTVVKNGTEVTLTPEQYTLTKETAGDWFTLDGYEDGQLMVYADANPTSESRFSTVRVTLKADPTLMASFEVSQSPMTLESNPLAYIAHYYTHVAGNEFNTNLWNNGQTAYYTQSDALQRFGSGIRMVNGGAGVTWHLPSTNEMLAIFPGSGGAIQFPLDSRGEKIDWDVEDVSVSPTLTSPCIVVCGQPLYAADLPSTDPRTGRKVLLGDYKYIYREVIEDGHPKKIAEVRGLRFKRFPKYRSAWRYEYMYDDAGYFATAVRVTCRNVGMDVNISHISDDEFWEDQTAVQATRWFSMTGFYNQSGALVSQKNSAVLWTTSRGGGSAGTMGLTVYIQRSSALSEHLLSPKSKCPVRLFSDRPLPDKDGAMVGY